jgi:hypothetical protein
VKNLVPTINCKVLTSDGAIGLVKGVAPNEQPENLLIKYPNREEQWVRVSEVQNGFTEKNYVIHKPPKGVGANLGLGLILLSRTQFGFTQMLVHFVHYQRAYRCGT